MKTLALVMCNNMHMDIQRANEILSCIDQKAYEIISDYTKADIVIIMTCAFGNGKSYSMYVIADVRRNCKPNAKVVVTGCLAKLNQKELEAIEGIIVKPSIFKEENSILKEASNIPQNKVIISMGCMRKCSYCVYPLLGQYVSKPVEIILKEVKELYESEFTIYITGGLETSDYGIDLYGRRKFAELLDFICTNYPNCNYIIGWLHPIGLTDELLSVISKHKNIVEVMVHIQHVNEKILMSMNRPTFEFTNQRLQRLRRLRPDIAISTEVIVGFPGEGEKEFDELVSYLDQGLFNEIAVASYEPVYGTKAATLPNMLPWNVRNERMEYIKNRYHCSSYPAPPPEKELKPILASYMEACKQLSVIPSMIILPAKRQKLQCIAGTDTIYKTKEGFSKLLEETFEQILNARDELSINETRKMIWDTYTFEFRQYIYEVFKSFKQKPELIKRAKRILDLID